MAPTDTDTAAIQYILDEETSAWNRGDAEGFARYFAADGHFTNIVGLFFVGHQHFQERHAQIMQGPFRQTLFRQELVSLKFITPFVALVETFVRVSGCSRSGGLPGVFIDEQGRLHTCLLQVMVKEGSGWKIAAYHNVDVKPGIPLPPDKT